MEKQTRFAEKIGGWLSHIYTMCVVIFAWVVFRADSLKEACIYIGNMIALNSTDFADAYFVGMMKSSAFVLVIGCVLSAPVYQKITGLFRTRSRACEEIFRALVCISLFVISVIETVTATYNPFIYFNF